MAAYDNKVLDGAGVAKLSQLIKEEIASSSGGSGGSGLPEYPSTSGNYQLLLAIDNGGNETLSWITLSGVWQYPLQTGNNLALYQGAVIHQYNNNLEII